MIKLRNTTDLQKFFIAKNCARGFIPKLSKVDVEFTENGEFSVTPPTGYIGISEVDVTVNVDAPLFFDENGGSFSTDTTGWTDIPEWITVNGNEVTVQPTTVVRSAIVGNFRIEQIIENYNTVPLTLTALEDGTITWNTLENNPKTIEYSLNNGDWTEITSTSAGVEIPVTVGDYIQFRGNNTAYGDDDDNYNFFSGSAKFDVSGNIMSLISSTNFAELTTVGDYAFKRMFGNSRIQSAENLVLPATTVGRHSYSMMFLFSLLKIPPKVIPAVGENSCYEMFQGTRITKAPELPATTLAINCYQNMFYDCTSLTTAPELPATTLVSYCYGGMFSGCTSLTEAPELPATTLVQYCYQHMFNYCTSLNYVKCLAEDITANHCTYRWMNNVSPTGTFVRKYRFNGWPEGINGIPTGWTIEESE